MRKAWNSIKKLLWWGVCEPLSCCLFFRLLSQSLFRCSPACFARLHWDDSRKQSALVIITSPVSPGFPQESVLVESPRNKVDLRESPGFYESKGGTAVRALASHRSGPGSNLRFNATCWVEFVVGSLPSSERFFSGYPGFLLSLKNNTSKLIWNTRTRLNEFLI